MNKIVPHHSRRKKVFERKDIFSLKKSILIIIKSIYMNKIRLYKSIFGPAHEIHCRTTKAQASLRICADSPESLLLAYTKYVCR